MFMVNFFFWYLGFFMMVELSSLVCLLLVIVLFKIFFIKYVCVVKVSVSIIIIIMERSIYLMYLELFEFDSNL